MILLFRYNFYQVIPGKRPLIRCFIFLLAAEMTENGRTNFERKYVNCNTLCPKKVSPLNISQQPPQTCTDLNEILHTQDDIYFCH